MSEYKLKPCPFCGGEANKRDVSYSIKPSGEVIHYYVECSTCSACGSPFDCEKHDDPISEAIEAWNTRA